MINDAFATDLRRWRNKRKLNQETLADNAGISARYVKYLEAGEKQPTLTTIFKLCRALKITPDDLILSTYEKWKETQD